MAEMTTSAAHASFEKLVDRVAQGNERVLLHRDDQALAAVVPVEDHELLQRIKAADQEWFWSGRWQQMERESDESYAAGSYTVHDDLDSFFEALDAAASDDKPAS